MMMQVMIGLFVAMIGIAGILAWKLESAMKDNATLKSNQTHLESAVTQAEKNLQQEKEQSELKDRLLTDSLGVTVQISERTTDTIEVIREIEVPVGDQNCLDADMPDSLIRVFAAGADSHSN